VSSKERHFEIEVKMYKEVVIFDEDTDVELSFKYELAREHNIDCDNPNVELKIREVKYE
jgi:hypothetical protein